MALSDADVDETMAEDWKAIQEKYTVEEPEAPAEQPESASEGTPESQETAPDRPRDESGKFTKAPKESKPERKTPSAEASPAKAAAPDAGGESGGPPNLSPSLAPEPQQRDVNRAPSSWKPLERAIWEKVPPEARAAIHRRESDFLAGQQQLLPDAQLGKGMREAIAPYEMLIRAEGGTAERAVADLMRTAAVFRVGTPQQKTQAVGQIIQQFGVDIRPLLGQQPQPGTQPTQQQFRDPRVDQLLANQARDVTQRQQREQQELETTVTRWMGQTDEKGEPKWPYLSDVISDMAALLPQIREANPSLTYDQALAEGYQRAVWAHPEIRTLLQQQAASDSEAQRRADNQTRVRDARRAASVNVPRRASLPSPGKPGTIEETIAATARELGLIT